MGWNAQAAELYFGLFFTSGEPRPKFPHGLNLHCWLLPLVAKPLCQGLLLFRQVFSKVVTLKPIIFLQPVFIIEFFIFFL